MYVPKPFVWQDRAEIAAMIAAHNFGLLVTQSAAGLEATHLPFLYDPEEGHEDFPGGRLLGHIARANPQCAAIETLAESGGEALAVIQGPHAYVSPNWYATGGKVPTWNYQAVHLYGRPRLLDPAATSALMARLVETHEAPLAAPWSLQSLDERKRRGLENAILAFEIPIARLEAKAKLSQDKPAEEALSAAMGIAEAFPEDPLAQATAAEMRRRATTED
ncbi:MAG: FMN-binding negative transcriptional regulator [Rhodovibrionaceae bacterium]